MSAPSVLCWLFFGKPTLPGALGYTSVYVPRPPHFRIAMIRPLDLERDWCQEPLRLRIIPRVSTYPPQFYPGNLVSSLQVHAVKDETQGDAVRMANRQDKQKTPGRLPWGFCGNPKKGSPK